MSRRLAPHDPPIGTLGPMRIGVLLDYPPQARFRRATLAAIEHAARAVEGSDIELVVLPTDTPDLAAEVERRCAGVVIGPGSPYRDEVAVWQVIASARERGLPLVGT